jgi:hypothetical protein
MDKKLVAGQNPSPKVQMGMGNAPPRVWKHIQKKQKATVKAGRK